MFYFSSLNLLIWTYSIDLIGIEEASVMKKLNEFVTKHPLYFLFFIAIIVGLFKLFLNIIKQRPVYEELDIIIYTFCLYFVCWIISKTVHNTYIRFCVAAFINFIYLSIQMFFDGSYVNYTSFIVTGGVAAFIAVMMVIIMHMFFDSHKTK